MYFDLESERKILSSMLKDETKLKEDDFYDDGHKIVFNSIVKLFGNNITPSYMELAKECVKTGVMGLKELKGITSEMVPSNLTYWLQQVKSKSKLRKLVQLMHDTRNAIT